MKKIKEIYGEQQEREDYGKQTSNAYDQRQYRQRSGRRGEKRTKSLLGTGQLAGSFAVSVLLFAVALLLLRSLTAGEERGEALVAVKTVPAGSKITEYNWGDYFAFREVPVSCMPDGMAGDPSAFAGTFTVRQIERNEIIVAGDFVDRTKRAHAIVRPVEVSLGASMLSQMVGGTLREGDIVNISSVRQQSGTNGQTYTVVNESIAREVYVTNAFTSTGVRVPSEDRETPAVVVNILLSEETEARLNAALADGTLHISRLVKE